MMTPPLPLNAGTLGKILITGATTRIYEVAESFRPDTLC
jgi:hypothetical protein